MSQAITKNRILSIDLLRGLAIVIMALDHTRDFFHAQSMVIDPADLSKTTVLLFFTRWITHFCAPVLTFLAGTSAFLVGQRKTKKELSFFLLTRGLWLVFLEFTVVLFGWTFNIHFPFFSLLVIWALGIGMISLSLLVFLPYRFVLVFGLVLVFGHNLLDQVHVPGSSTKAFLWSVLHEPGRFMYGDTLIRVKYPVLPWIGVICLGYCFGNLYLPQVNAKNRRKWLFVMGCTSILVFLVLRAINVYGEPRPWSYQTTRTFTILSFLDLTKYPPSLLFILVTLGPALLFLTFTEKPAGWLGKALVHIGRVPMFFYLAHIYFLHILAVLAAILTGFTFDDMVSKVPLTPTPKGYGFTLAVTYAVWLSVVVILYPLCKRYDNYKLLHKEKWWLSYL